MNTMVAVAGQEVPIDGNPWGRDGRFVAQLIIRDGDVPAPGDVIEFDSPPLSVYGVIQRAHPVNRVGRLQIAVVRGGCMFTPNPIAGVYGSTDMTVTRNDKPASCTHFTVVED